MEQARSDVQEQNLSSAREAEAAPVIVEAVVPQACATCGAVPSTNANPVTTAPWVYVIGHIEPQFPLISIDKEVRQAIARGAASKDTDREAMAKLLRDPGNMYIARRLCWVFSVQGVETYILIPSDGNYQPLIEAYRAQPDPGDLELAIGAKGPIAPPTMCNGLQIPILIFDQIYAFDRGSLLKSLATPKGLDAQRFTRAAAEMFDRIMNQSDNAGATECDRALNYLSVRYARIYALASEQFANNAAFSGIDCRPSPLSATRRIVDVIFSFRDRATDVVSKFFTRVDVTECFPFLVTALSPYYDR